MKGFYFLYAISIAAEWERQGVKINLFWTLLGVWVFIVAANFAINWNHCSSLECDWCKNSLIFSVYPDST